VNSYVKPIFPENHRTSRSFVFGKLLICSHKQSLCSCAGV